MLKCIWSLAPAILTLALAGVYPGAYAGTISGASDKQAGSSVTAPEGAAESRSAVGASDASGSSMTSGASRAVRADTAADDVPIENLKAATRSLRAGILKLAEAPPGERRTEAIRESNEALMQVQSAIAALPPELRNANVDEPAYNDAMDKLKQASDRLIAAADALANQPPQQGRDEAIKEVNQALLETNEAMLTGMQLSAAGSASGTSGSASSGSSGDGAADDQR